MSPINALSLGCLIVTGLICAWGVFSENFDDNVLQRIGLSIVTIGITARTYERLTEPVPEPPLVLLWSQIGLALYAIGTVVRFWRASLGQANRRRPKRRRGLHA